ncbi:hypothetical protein EC957_009067 [Mortierella hygrophila]|uniref:Dilute domain-containing protein n=1 Tax=Mortierella hygrophila TaxID=979708 RepID=A0A9P6FBE4_9FUNG|nr:hypothetical protein EC957_009067 [Mortierella hygrophila]
MDDDTHSDMHRRSYSEVETLCSEHSESTEYEPVPLRGRFSRPQSTESLSQFNSSLKQQQPEQQEQQYKDMVDSADDCVAQGPGFSRLEDLTPTSPLNNTITPSPSTTDFEHSDNTNKTMTTTTTESNSLQMTTESGSILEPEPTEQYQHQQDGRFSPTSFTLSQSTTPSIFEFSQADLDDPRAIMCRPFTDEDKKIKMSRLFSRAASNGDLQRIVDLLDNFRDWVDLEYHEDDGTTPLIYAACFGHTAVTFMLLDAGALIDACDRSGWTALVWATNNKHEHMVRLLLEHGASTKATTTKGRTIADFLRHDPNDTAKIAQIFQEPTVTGSNRNSTTVDRNSGGGDGGRRTGGGYDPLGIESFEENMSESEWQYRLKRDTADAEGGGDTMGSNCSLPDQYQDDDGSEFDWERCLADQMFVFSSSDIGHIIETTITTMDPTRSRTHEPVPAYVIFLAARFAHYFSSPELLDDLLEATLHAIETVAMGKPDDMALGAYWISNTTALLHFLRKDTGIDAASVDYHPRFEALLIDMTQMVILDAERRIEKVLGPAMLDHDTIVGLDEVKFQSDWAFWRGIGIRSTNNNYSNSKRVSAPPSTLAGLYPPPCFKRASLQLTRPSSPRQRSISPRTVTTMLSSLLYLMQTYDVHTDIVHYIVIQVMYYIACEVFNRIMDNRTFLTRSKALQTRLNLSILEDWLRNNRLPSRLAEPLMPLIQLLQLLQVLSLQSDLTMWIETRKKLELLNPAQVKHVVSTYRYEVNECRLPTEVTKYVLQVVADTEKVIRKKRSDETLSGSSIMASSASGSGKSSRRNSSQAGMDAGASSDSNMDEDGFGDSTSSTGTTKVQSQAGTRAGEASGSRTGSVMNETEIEQVWTQRQKPCRVRTPVQTEEQRRKGCSKVVEEDEEYQTSQTKDSMVWIHFTLPTNLAAREGTVDRVYVPQIPDDMMSLLDSYGH